MVETLDRPPALLSRLTLPPTPLSIWPSRVAVAVIGVTFDIPAPPSRHNFSSHLNASAALLTILPYSLSMATRELRKRKERPESQTPTILDDIFVYWEVGGSKFWWPASVIELESYDVANGSKYGRGKLLYRRYRSYAPEEA